MCGTCRHPTGLDQARWLSTFPSFGYLLAVTTADAAAVISRFLDRGIACADIGGIVEGHRVVITDGVSTETIWDFAEHPLLGCARTREAA